MKIILINIIFIAQKIVFGPTVGGRHNGQLSSKRQNN